MKTHIFKIRNILLKNCSLNNDALFKRKCKIKFKDVFYYLAQLISDSKKSFLIVASKLNCNKFNTAKNDAFRKKRQNIDITYFNKIFNELNDYHNNHFESLLFNKYRLLCTDGTHYPLPK
jgi:hypothetical protein